MRVRNATGLGIALGAGIGAIAFGWIKVEQQTQLNFQAYAWWIVVLTTLVPLVTYLSEKQLVTGTVGGFLNGLGTGLGFFLLLAGRVI